MAPPVKKKLLKTTGRVRNWVRKRVPPGFRLPIGLVVMVGGVFGMLPVFGFWMIPLGAAIAAMDVGPLWRYLTGRKRGEGRKP